MIQILIKMLNSHIPKIVLYWLKRDFISKETASAQIVPRAFSDAHAAGNDSANDSIIWTDAEL